MKKYILCAVMVLFLSGCSMLPAIQSGKSLPEYLNSIGFSGSILIAREGVVIHAGGYGYADRSAQVPNKPDTPFYIASLTKQFTAAAMLQMQEQGKLHLDHTVARYLPDFPNGNKIKLRHLLQHSSGLQDVIKEWDDFKTRPLSQQDIINRFKNKPLDFQPGTKIAYSSSGYFLAGQIIEQVSGQPYEKYIRRNIFEPLGMKQSGYGKNSPHLKTAYGYIKNTPQTHINMNLPHAAGSIISSITDLHKWDRAFYSEKILGKASQNEMFPKDRKAMGQGFGTGRFKVVMGLGWGVYQTTHGPEYSHTGNVDGFSTVISRYPKQQAVIIILSNRNNFDVTGLKNRLAGLMLP